MKTNLNQNFRLQLEANNNKHMNHLTKSDLKPEEYLTKFAEYCVEIAVQSGWGSRENLGTGLTVHISDTRGRKTSANANLGHAVGICWHSITSEGNHRRIEIDRETSDTIKALEIVAHEVSHAVTSEGTGHKGAFLELVFGVFKLGGIPTATAPTEEFKNLIWNWLEQNGTYPHIRFVDRRPRQTTRMVKIACIDMDCGGATRASIKQGLGTIFRLSSAVVFKQADNICCPVCAGSVSIESEVTQEIYK